jgi:diguanylate cyclase (GGDEF)-like protein/PAS domain S-box-containing protein
LFKCSLNILHLVQDGFYQGYLEKGDSMIEILNRRLRLYTVKSQVIFWTSLVVLFTGMAFFALITLLEIRQVEAAAVRNLYTTVRYEQQAMERWMEERRMDMRALAQLMAEFVDGEADKGERLMTVLEGFNADHPDFEGLSAADASGRPAAAAVGIGAAVPPDEETFRQVRSGMDAAAIVRSNAQPGSARFVFAAPVYGKMGQFMGAVIGAVNPERLLRRKEGAAEWQTQRTYLIAPDGEILYGIRHDGEPVFESGDEPVNLAELPLFQLPAAETPLRDAHKDYRSVSVFSAARWTADGRLLLMQTIDRAEVVSSVQPIIQLTAMLLIVVMIAAWIAVIWIAGRLFRPLADLLHAVQVKRIGRTDAGLIRARGRDMSGEWKALFDAFAGLAENLSEAHRELAAGGASAAADRAEAAGQPPRSGDWFHEIFTRAGIGIAVIDDSGRFVETNPALQHLLGYSGEELAQKRLSRFVDEAEADFDRERMHPSRSYSVEKRIYHKDGYLIWTRMTITDLRSFAGRRDCRMLVFEDITPHRRALEALEESENLYRSLVDLSPDAVMVHIDGIFMYVNEKTVQLLGGTRVEDVLFKPLLGFIEPEDHRTVVEVIRELYEQGKPKMNIDARFMRLDGRVIDVELSASLVSYHHKRAILMLARDVTERKRNEDQIRRINQLLQKLSSTDGLTNIANRRTFDTILEKEWRRALRARTPLALILLDIDDFKPYNDTYGHQGGDQALKAIANVLNGAAKREGDLAARYGGEEFALLLPNTDEAGAESVAANILHQVEQLKIPHAGSDISPYVTVSIGVASMIPQPQTTPRQLVDRADQALYMAKREGRNRVRRYEPGGSR